MPFDLYYGPLAGLLLELLPLLVDLCLRDYRGYGREAITQFQFHYFLAGLLERLEIRNLHDKRVGTTQGLI